MHVRPHNALTLGGWGVDGVAVDILHLKRGGWGL